MGDLCEKKVIFPLEKMKILSTFSKSLKKTLKHFFLFMPPSPQLRRHEVGPKLCCSYGRERIQCQLQISFR